MQATSARGDVERLLPAVRLEHPVTSGGTQRTVHARDARRDDRATATSPAETRRQNGLAGHHSLRSRRWEPDPLILDERFIAASVPGRGVTVLSACSHAGIVNVCLQAQRDFPGARIDLVLGGYHLAGAAMEPRIDATVRDLSYRIRPRLVAPGHCTGWRAKAKLAQAFAPGRYAPSVVGARYALNDRS